MTTINTQEVVQYAPTGCAETFGPVGDREVDSIVSLSGTLAGVIEQIRSQRTVTGLPLSVHDSIVVISCPFTDELDWEFLPLIAVLAEARASALAVCLPSTAFISRSAIELAHRRGIAVLAVKDPWLFAAAVVDLLGGASHLESKLIRTTADHCQQRAGSLDQLLQRICAAVGHTVNLSDREGRLLAGSRSTETNASTGESAGVGQSAPASRYVRGGRSTIFVPVPSPHVTQPLLTTSLDNATRGEFDAVLASLKVASLGVSEHLANQRVELERNARSRTALLSDLLESGPELVPGLYVRARNAGWSLDGYHMGARAIVRTDLDLVNRRPELEQALADAGLNAIAVEQSDGWAMWASFASRPEAARTNAWGMAWRHAQQILRHTIPIQLGVGRVHQGAAGLARSLAEAGDAARIAAGREHHAYFVQIDRLNIAQRLLAWTSTESFLPAALELLEPLRNKTDAVVTLNAYLDAESSLVDTAAVLGIHRNTVRDRIVRIRTELAVDLDDPDTRLALQLACRSVLATRS